MDSGEPGVARQPAHRASRVAARRTAAVRRRCQGRWEGLLAGRTATRALRFSRLPSDRRTGRRSRCRQARSVSAGRGVEWYPEGTARRLPKDAYIEINVHYQPSGKPETDRTRLGLYLAKGAVRREIRNGGGVDPAGFREVAGRGTLAGQVPNIPPFAENFRVSGTTVFSRPATLYALSPHMHLRGKDMTFILVRPDGREEVLLSVPKFDFNWQLVTSWRHPFGCRPAAGCERSRTTTTPAGTATTRRRTRRWRGRSRAPTRCSAQRSGSPTTISI